MSKLVIPTTIVAGFHGIGKSTLVRDFPDKIIELDAVNYQYTINDEGQKIKNTEWPNNYIEDIKKLNESRHYAAVLVSAHPLVCHLMAEAGVRYTIVTPNIDNKSKQIILERLHKCGKTPAFIAAIDKNYAGMVSFLLKDSNAANIVVLHHFNINQFGSYILQRSHF